MSGFFERMTQRAAGTEVRWQSRPRAVFEPRSGPGPFAAPGPGDGSGVGGSWAAPGSSGSLTTPWGEGRDGGRTRADDVRLDGRGGRRSGAAGPLDAAGGPVRGASWWAVGEWSDGEGPRSTVPGGEMPGGEVPGGGFDRAFDGDRPGRDGFDREGLGDDALGPDELGGGRPGRGLTGSGPSGWDRPGRHGGGDAQHGGRVSATRGGDRSGTAGARSPRGGVPAELGPRGTVGRSRSRGTGAGRGGPAPDEGSRGAGHRTDAARSDRQDRDARSRWAAPDHGDRAAAPPGTDDPWAPGDGWPLAPAGASDPGGASDTGAGSVPADRPPATAGDGTSAAWAARARGAVPEVADLLRDRLVPELRARGVIGAAERVDLRARGRAPRPGATTLGWTVDGEARGAPTTGRGADGRPGSGADVGGVHLHIDRVEVVRPVVEPRPAPASGTREPSRLDAYLERRRTDRR